MLERIFGEEVVINNDSLGAVHLMVRHEESRNGNGNTAISCGGEGGDMRRSGVEMHGKMEKMKG